MAPQYPNTSSRRSRPRQARPALRPVRERSDITRRLGQHASRNAASRYPQHRQPRVGGGDRRSDSNERRGRHADQHGEEGSGLGQAAMSMLVGELVEELVDYIVRHNFFRRHWQGNPAGESNRAATRQTRTSAAEPPRQGQPEPRLQQSTSQSSLESRQRRRRHRRSEVLMSSLDRLSAELETTYDALMRVGHAPRNGEVHAGDQPLMDNVDDLRRAITRATARIESIRHHHRAMRRGSGSARSTRLGSMVSRAASDAE